VICGVTTKRQKNRLPGPAQDRDWRKWRRVLVLRR
jgi:hypothetical protein